MKTLLTITLFLLTATTYGQESVLERSIEVKESVKESFRLVEQEPKSVLIEPSTRNPTPQPLIVNQPVIYYYVEPKSVNPFQYMYESWKNRPRLQLKFVQPCR